MLQCWYYVKSSTGQRHDNNPNWKPRITIADSRFDLVGSRQHGVASSEVISWSTDHPLDADGDYTLNPFKNHCLVIKQPIQICVYSINNISSTIQLKHTKIFIVIKVSTSVTIQNLVIKKLYWRKEKKICKDSRRDSGHSNFSYARYSDNCHI